MRSPEWEQRPIPLCPGFCISGMFCSCTRLAHKGGRWPSFLDGVSGLSNSGLRISLLVKVQKIFWKANVEVRYGRANLRSQHSGRLSRRTAGWGLIWAAWCLGPVSKPSPIKNPTVPTGQHLLCYYKHSNKLLSNYRKVFYVVYSWLSPKFPSILTAKHRTIKVLRRPGFWPPCQATHLLPAGLELHQCNFPIR